MAKISTRKPTTLIHVKRSGSAESPPVSTPVETPPVRVETAAAPPPPRAERVVEQEKIPEKIEKTASTKAVPPRTDIVGAKPKANPLPRVETVAKPVTKPVAAPVASPVPSLAQAKGSNDTFKRFVFAAVGVLLLGFSYKHYTNEKKAENLGAEQLSQSASQTDMGEFLMENDSARESASQWKNEEPGMFSKPFHKLCLGYAKSDGCADVPLHPFKKVADDIGIELTFAKEPSHKVIEQTIEYRSKAYTLK